MSGSFGKAGPVNSEENTTSNFASAKSCVVFLECGKYKGKEN